MTAGKAGTSTRINVEVTERDIERAHISDSYRCVVAQAVARTVTDATRIEVDTQSIRFTRGGARFIYLTPYAVQGYVIAFDAGETIEPFTFQLRNPQSVARRRLTETGKKAERERTRAKRAVEAVADAGVPAKAKRKAKGKADARTVYADVVAAGGEPARVSTAGQRQAPPRVFKTKSRSYGHRLLRINQQPVE